MYKIKSSHDIPILQRPSMRKHLGAVMGSAWLLKKMNLNQSSHRWTTALLMSLNKCFHSKCVIKLCCSSAYHLNNSHVHLSLARFRLNAVYCGMPLSTSKLHADPCMSCFISAAVEVPAYMSSCLALRFLPQRWPVICVLLVGSLSLLFIQLVPNSRETFNLCEYFRYRMMLSFVFIWCTRALLQLKELFLLGPGHRSASDCKAPSTNMREPYCIWRIWYY